MVNKKAIVKPLARRKQNKKKVPEAKYRLDYKARANSKGSFPCPDCGTNFTLKSSMKSHQRCHYDKVIKIKKNKRETKNLGPTMGRVHNEMVDVLKTTIPDEDQELIYDPGGEDEDDHSDEHLHHVAEEELLFLHGEEVVGGQPLLPDSDSEEDDPTKNMETIEQKAHRDLYYESSLFEDCSIPPPWNHEDTFVMALDGKPIATTCSVFENDELNRDVYHFVESASLSLPSQELLHELLMNHLSEEQQEKLETPRRIIELLKQSDDKGTRFVSHNLYSGPLYINTTMQLADSTVVLISMLKDPLIDKQMVSYSSCVGNDNFFTYVFHFFQDYELEVELKAGTLEVLWSTSVNSSEVCQWQKKDAKETSENQESKVVLVTFYWDKTGKDNRNKHQMHNIFLGIASMDPNGRTKWSARRHLGMLPIPEINVLNIPDNISAHAWHEEVKLFERHLYQFALKWLFESLCYHQHYGFPFKRIDGADGKKGDTFNLVPRVYNLAGDIPEGSLR